MLEHFVLAVACGLVVALSISALGVWKLAAKVDALTQEVQAGADAAQKGTARLSRRLNQHETRITRLEVRINAPDP